MAQPISPSSVEKLNYYFRVEFHAKDASIHADISPEAIKGFKCSVQNYIWALHETGLVKNVSLEKNSAPLVAINIDTDDPDTRKNFNFFSDSKRMKSNTGDSFRVNVYFYDSENEKAEQRYETLICLNGLYYLEAYYKAWKDEEEFQKQLQIQVDEIARSLK